jgi:hypothetical protein
MAKKIKATTKTISRNNRLDIAILSTLLHQVLEQTILSPKQMAMSVTQRYCSTSLHDELLTLEDFTSTKMLKKNKLIISRRLSILESCGFIKQEDAINFYSSPKPLGAYKNAKCYIVTGDGWLYLISLLIHPDFVNHTDISEIYLRSSILKEYIQLNKKFWSIIVKMVNTQSPFSKMYLEAAKYFSNSYTKYEHFLATYLSIKQLKKENISYLKKLKTNGANTLLIDSIINVYQSI